MFLEAYLKGYEIFAKFLVLQPKKSVTFNSFCELNLFVTVHELMLFTVLKHICVRACVRAHSLVLLSLFL